MRRWLRIWIALTTLFATASFTGSAGATPPSYLVLRAPIAANSHQPVYNPGRGYAVQTPAYSYGWFGAHPRPQWSRHFGFYRNYTEWSAR